MAKKENTASTEVKEEVILDSERRLTKEEIKAANAMLDEIEKAMLVMNEDGSLEEF